MTALDEHTRRPCRAEAGLLAELVSVNPIAISQEYFGVLSKAKASTICWAVHSAVG